MKPLSPDELKLRAADALPDFVIESVNECLMRAAGSGKRSITVMQDDIIDELLKRGPAKLTRTEIFERKLLDFEQAFRNVGWEVTYDKPGYNETGRAFFVFSRGEE